MKMYVIPNLDVWIFGGGWSRNEIWTKKQPVRTCRLFFPNLDKKITGFEIWKGFGDDLEHPSIWIFEHLYR
jgi:hypothetical protein